MQTKIKRISRRTVSLVLTVLMLVSMTIVGTVTASAYSQIEGITSVKLWIWNQNGEVDGVNTSGSNHSFDMPSNNDSDLQFGGDYYFKTTTSSGETWDYTSKFQINDGAYYGGYDNGDHVYSATGDYWHLWNGHPRDNTFKVPYATNGYKKVSIWLDPYAGPSYDSSKVYIAYNAVDDLSSTGSLTYESSTVTAGGSAIDVAGSPTPSGGSGSYTKTYSVARKSGDSSASASINASTGAFTPPASVSETTVFTVTCTITDTKCTGLTGTTATCDITVNPAATCTPSFTVGGEPSSAETIYTDQTLTFQGVHSYDASNGTITYTVSKDGGEYSAQYLSAYSGAGSDITFTPSGAGEYKIKAVCSRDGNNSELTVTVHNRPEVSLIGGFRPNGWTHGTTNVMEYNSTDDCWYVEQDLNSAYSYPQNGNWGFCIYVVNNAGTETKYGNTGTMASNNCTDWTFAANEQNAGITPSLTGTYIFKVTIDDDESDAPVVSVLYPHTVSFDSKGGSEVASQVVKYGGKASEPDSDPTKTGYTFDKWVTTDGGSTEFDFDGTTITADTPVYASWTANTTALTYNTNGGTGSVPVTNVAVYGQAMPNYVYSKPAKTGYTFQGYYIGETQYYDNSNTPASVKAWDVDADYATLTAKWSEITGGIHVQPETGGKVRTTAEGEGSAFVNLDGVGISTKATVYAAADTGYTFTGWEIDESKAQYEHIKLYTNEACTSEYTSGAISPIYIKTDGASGLTTENAVVKATFSINQYDITVNRVSLSTDADNLAGSYSSNNSAGTITINETTTTSATLDYNTAVTITASPASGYVFMGFYDGEGSQLALSSYEFSLGAADVTVYARFEKKYTLTFVDSINTSDGHFSEVNNNAAQANSTVTQYADDALSSSQVPDWAASHPGYHFEGWKINNAGDLLTAAEVVEALEARGTEVDATINAIYSKIDYTVAVTQHYYDATAKQSGNKATVTGTTSTADYNDEITLAVSSVDSNYRFVGWYAAGAADNATPVSRLASYTFTLTDNVSLEARFRHIYHITVYNATVEKNGEWHILASPPRTVKRIDPDGTTIATYTYAAGDASQRGEDDDHGAGTGTTHYVDTDEATYYEGNLLEVLAGEQVQLEYAAMSSSDIISAVCFNNDLRYTHELEDDNKYKNRVYKEEGTWPKGESDDEWDYTYYSDVLDVGDEGPIADTTLYANANYYTNPNKTRILRQTYAATVDQGTHTVSWTAVKDYKNIDIEIANKKQILFTDSNNTPEKEKEKGKNYKVNSITSDNYFAVGDNLYNNAGEDDGDRLRIYAKGNSSQTNTIDLSHVKLYYYSALKGSYTNEYGVAVAKRNRVELSLEDKFSILCSDGEASSIASSGSSNSTNYFYFSGTMPATDVMVDLNVDVSYTIKLDSKMQSDTIRESGKFNRAATVTAGELSQAYSYSTDGIEQGPATVSADTPISLSLAYGSYEEVSWAGSYMFIGWYKSALDATAPDFVNGKISAEESYSYTPEESCKIWAVGTRELYINGCAALIEEIDSDWNTGLSGDVNIPMKFDPEVGTKGSYYYEVTDAAYRATNETTPKFETTQDEPNAWDTHTKMYTKNTGNNKYYWTDNEGEHGNAFFQIRDAEEGSSDGIKTIWAGIDSFQKNENGVTYGKIFPRDKSDERSLLDGLGFINFNERDYAGYSTPLKIYLDADTKELSVKATHVYPHIYLSNGTYGVDGDSSYRTQVSINGTAITDLNTLDAGDTSSTGLLKRVGDGWIYGQGTDLAVEDNVYDYEIQARNAEITLTKQVSDASEYRVRGFMVYNLADGTISAIKAERDGETNTFSATYTTDEDKSVYICPVIEYVDYHAADEDGKPEKMNIVVDASELDYSQWGKFVACYAWYSDGLTSANANGAYPGQLMFYNAQDKSWEINIPAFKPGDSTKKLVGITFTNYIGKTDSSPNTWITGSSVIGDADGTLENGELIDLYNSVGKGDYNRKNFKVQTYDYREPIAYLSNKDASVKEMKLNFSLKNGNGDMIAWTHTDLVTENIKSHIGDAEHPLDFEYLTDTSGAYTDLNGFVLDDKPTASFYIVAKGMVTYNNSLLKRVFWSNNSYQTYNGSGNNPYGVTKPGYNPSGELKYTGYKNEPAEIASGESPGEIGLDYAVQWYIYDASGNYITTILSAALADKDASKTNKSLIGEKLLDMGFAVDSKSVAICYDVPRLCYNTGTYPNDGTTDDAYRFTGQWYQKSDIDLAKVYAKVGLRTDSGDTVSDGSTEVYGSATAAVNALLLDYTSAGQYGTATDIEGCNYAYTTVFDGDKGAVTLTADNSNGNFIGWHYYDEEGKLQRATASVNFTPESYSKDITYVALYEASAIYSYKYTGREGEKFFGVNVGRLTAPEIGAGNILNKARADLFAAANMPTSTAVTIFKKTLSWLDLSSASEEARNAKLDNETQYTMKVDNAQIANEKFDLVVFYPSAKGEANAKQINNVDASKVAYNTTVDLAYANVWSLAPEGQVFKGWYETDAAGTSTGRLLSKQPNFGQVVIKNTYIKAVFDDSYHSGNDNWEVYIEDQDDTREMTSATVGTVYNDSIVWVRQNNAAPTSLPDGAKVGIIVVDDGGTGSNIDDINETKLTTLATKLGNGATGSLSAGQKVTNVYTTSLSYFGRVDLAAKYNYSKVAGHNYYVYAYVYDGENYHFDTTNAYETGTYGTYVPYVAP